MDHRNCHGMVDEDFRGASDLRPEEVEEISEKGGSRMHLLSKEVEDGKKE